MGKIGVRPYSPLVKITGFWGFLEEFREDLGARVYAGGSPRRFFLRHPCADRDPRNFIPENSSIPEYRSSRRHFRVRNHEVF